MMILALFMHYLGGLEVHITIRNAANLTAGGWFDKLDPYAIIRFRGSREEHVVVALLVCLGHLSDMRIT